jgi:hypothetical protein
VLTAEAQRDGAHLAPSRSVNQLSCPDGATRSTSREALLHTSLIEGRSLV